MDLFQKISLRLKQFFGALFYLRYAPQTILYSFQRDRLNRQLAVGPTGESFEPPGKLLRAEKTVRGARFYFEQAELEISFLAPDLVRVEWFPGIPPIPYAIARSDWPEVETTLDKTDNGWIVSSSDSANHVPKTLKVIVGINGSVKFCDSAGQTLREDIPPQRQGERWVHQAQLQSEEHIYGLGERAFPLNLRKAKDNKQRSIAFQMWNSDPGGHYRPEFDPLYICIPIYLGLNSWGSYLIFYENTYPATFTFAESATANFEGGALRYYLTAGSPAQLLERYTELTGRPPLPPRWALGYHQSRWGYNTEAVVREIVNCFERYNLPLSAIHLDIDTQAGYRAFTIDPERFPKLTSFTQELAAKGVRLIAINNPGIKYSGFQGFASGELYLRWFQMSCFFTFCRTHSSVRSEHRNPWTFGEPYLSIIRQFLQLRYRLLPYFYTLSWEAQEKGYPPVRPLFWFDSNDPALWDVDDAFFLGEALLICPIVEEGARSRSAILPQGHWYNFWDDALLEGARQVDFEAPLERIPVLVKAGSILPMEEDKQLILHLYPPMQGSSEGWVYSDAGDGYGEWRIDRFRMVRDEDSLELTWEEQGEYTLAYQKIQLHLHGFEPRQAWVDGKEVMVQGQYLECVQDNHAEGIRFQQVRFVS